MNILIWLLQPVERVLAPRDITPEATAKVIEKEAPGLAETIRRHGKERTPLCNVVTRTGWHMRQNINH